MDPESKKLRQLEAYVQQLEAENRVLRAKLRKGNAEPIDSSANEACQSDGYSNQNDEHEGIIQPVANPLSPEAKIRLFKTGFQDELISTRDDGRVATVRKKVMHQCVGMNGVKVSAKNQRFVATIAIIARLSLLLMVLSVNT